MEDIDYLRKNNIELQTELRLVKEQLSLAQSSTQYLINCMSNNQPDRHTIKVKKVERQLRKAECENVRLKHRLALIQSSRSRNNSSFSFSNTASLQLPWSVRSEQAGACGTTNASTPADLGGENLITFVDALRPPTSSDWITPPTSFSPTAVADSSLIDDSVTSQWTLIPPTHELREPAVTVSQPRPSNERSYNTQTEQQDIGGSALYLITQDDNLNCYLSSDFKADDHPTASTRIDPDPNFESALVDLNEWRAIHSPSLPEPELAFSCRFLDAEHNRLMGAASFIEDMSVAERSDHWEMLACEKGRHTAEEWRLYYEEVVRPAYVAKSVKKDGTVAATRGCGDVENGVGEEARVSLVGKGSQGLEASRWAPKTLGEDADQREVSKERTSTDGMNVARIRSNPRQDGGDLSSDEDTSVVKIPYPLATLVDAPRGDKRTNEFLAPTALSPTAYELSPCIKDFDPAAQWEKPDLFSFQQETQDLHNSTASPPPPLKSPTSRSARTSRFPTEVSDILHDFQSIDPSLFRTVLITNIPIGVTLAQILTRVRGGKIVSATFLETAGMKTKPSLHTNMVMVVFLCAQAAKAFVQHCIGHHVCLPSPSGVEEEGFQEWAAQLSVSLVTTPTYPLHPHLRYDLHHRGLTRVLFIIDEQHLWTAETVLQELMMYEPRLVRPLVAWRDDDVVLFFEFADVREAVFASKVVEWHHRFFQGASKGYLPDPCARPPETLEEHAEEVDITKSSPVTSSAEQSMRDAMVNVCSPSSDVRGYDVDANCEGVEELEKVW